MMENARLELVDLSKTYCDGKRETRALEGLSLELGVGFYALLGPNGSGKSTTMNIVTGGLEPSRGFVLWNGDRAGSADFYRALGYMPQQQGMYDGFTGRMFLEYFCALKELPAGAVNDEVVRVARAVNLEDELGKRISMYSGGMKQRLLAAQALIGDPKLLIFDEPTAGLDPKERAHLRGVLRKTADEGRIVIVATHVVSDVESVADGVIVLKKGRLAGFDSVPNLVAKHAPGGGLEEVYLSIFGEDETA